MQGKKLFLFTTMLPTFCKTRGMKREFWTNNIGNRTFESTFPSMLSSHNTTFGLKRVKTFSRKKYTNNVFNMWNSVSNNILRLNILCPSRLFSKIGSLNLFRFSILYSSNIMRGSSKVFPLLVPLLLPITQVTTIIIIIFWDFIRKVVFSHAWMYRQRNRAFIWVGF